MLCMSKNILLHVDYGDMLLLSRRQDTYYGRERITRLMGRAAESGVTHILWRVSMVGMANYPSRVRYQLNDPAGQKLLDQDPFDPQMTHLVLLSAVDQQIVGTYRIQAASHALQHRGLYSAQEYDMAPLASHLDKTLELGRACLAKEHRAMDALLTLWSGLGHFMNLHELHYLVGCCSITSTDPDDGWRALKTLRNKNYMHPELFLRALPGYRCGEPSRVDAPDLGPPLKLPKLFRIYLLLGAHIISEPAIDREFGTVDFLTFMDGRQVKLSQLDLLK